MHAPETSSWGGIVSSSRRILRRSRFAFLRRIWWADHFAMATSSSGWGKFVISATSVELENKADGPSNFNIYAYISYISVKLCEYAAQEQRNPAIAWAEFSRLCRSVLAPDHLSDTCVGALLLLPWRIACWMNTCWLHLAKQQRKKTVALQLPTTRQNRNIEWITPM